MSDKLRECPWCGKIARRDDCISDINGNHMVRCSKCHAEGPPGEFYGMAEKLWDKRKNTKEPNQWISCEERMPEESGRYLCYVEEQGSLSLSKYVWNCAFNIGDNFWSDGHRSYRVTHWQPLPPAPTKTVIEELS